MGTLIVIGIGVGLASVAGVRAFLPLAIVGLSAALGLFELPSPLDLLGEWPVVGALFALALVEGGLDKVPALDPLLDYVQTPVRIVAGAVLFSAALLAGIDAAGVPGLVAGALIAGAVAIPKVVLRPSQRASGGVSTSFLSLLEDVVALIGGIVAVFVPLLPLVFVAFLLFFFFRVRRRRGRKYGGLRILGD